MEIPHTRQRVHSKVTNSGEQTMKLLLGTKPPQSYSFRSIYSRVRTKITQSYFFRSIYPRVRTRITPKQIHIHNTQSTQRTTKRPQSFYRRKDNKNVHQPLCIDYPNVTSGIRKLSAITYIMCS